jgi:hypothetical protein
MIWPYMVRYTNADNNRLNHSSNIKVMTPTILETAMLELLMGGIYEIYSWVGLRWHVLNTKFHDDFT